MLTNNCSLNDQLKNRGLFSIKAMHDLCRRYTVTARLESPIAIVQHLPHLKEPTKFIFSTVQCPAYALMELLGRLYSLKLLSPRPIISTKHLSQVRADPFQYFSSSNVLDNCVHLASLVLSFIRPLCNATTEDRGDRHGQRLMRKRKTVWGA